MKKILVIQTASIGDVILATAVIESLHLAYPRAIIDFLVKKGNEKLFDGHPFLNEVIAWDKRSEKYSGFLRILRKVRQTKYSLVVNIQRFFMTGLLTVLSGAGETRGFSKNPMSFLFTRSVQHPIGAGVHEVVRNNALVSDLCITGDMKPMLYPSVTDESAVAGFAAGKFYTISPASLWYTKQYPAEKWKELIRKIPEEAGICLLGATADKDRCEEIIQQAGRNGIVSLAGKLSFLQSAALMKRARMNFTNDSAPMHLASSVDAPVTAVYCSTIPGFGFGPLSSNAATAEISIPLYCRPCGLHGYKACPEKHFKCAFGIETKKLAERL
ncbi:MAG: glycosyltransferase family 9 protein [bacterium]